MKEDQILQIIATPFGYSMAFTCECGRHNHYGYFAPTVIECKQCGQAYMAGSEIKMQKIDKKEYEEYRDKVMGQ